MKNLNDKYMKAALKEATKCLLIDEVPVGCVIVKNNKIIAKGHNLREKTHDVTAHAEIVALRKASKKLNDWQLVDCSVYVTLEPCIMCAGALQQARVAKIVYGANDLKGGAFGSNINLLDVANLNHYPEIVAGVLKEECSNLLTNYFKNKRNK